MQSFFYLIEEGDAHYRNGKWNLALKRYCGVQKVCVGKILDSTDGRIDEVIGQVFDEIEDDQYDFHIYWLRKLTVNGYIKLVDF
jgi:hypothetical protein